MALTNRVVMLGLAAQLACACGDDGDRATGGGGAGGAPGTTSATGGPSVTSGDTSTATTTNASTSTGMMETFVGRCGDPKPAGAPDPAPAPPYSGGTCPALAAGMNTIASGGADRQFMLVLHSDYDES
ncbi:MAG: hypothetical protein HOV80_00605, partial [Polyangiaceae bacterium]|nr:hypothetical protein [Polyangiaceae bacterium]